MEDVRAATEADVASLAALARAAITDLTPLRGGGVWQAAEARQEPLEDGLGRLVKDAAARVLVGSLDGVALGYAVARLDRLGDGTTLGVIDDIYVVEGARGVGLGEAMMVDLIAWCTAAGCFGMDAMALPGDRATKNFFERAGFTARKLVMHHSLQPQGGDSG